MLNSKTISFAKSLCFFAAFWLPFQIIEAAEPLVNQGELCFKIVNRDEQAQIEKLLKIEILSSDTPNVTLTGVLLDLTDSQPHRYWVSGSAHSLSGNFDFGIDAWFSGHLIGVLDISEDVSQVQQVTVTFSLAVPFDAQRSEWLDNINNQLSLMSQSNCNDQEFAPMLSKDITDVNDGPGVIVIF